MRARLLGRPSKGQALAEVALVLPVFFLMVFGMIDLGRVIWANDVVANAAREGSRFASVNAGTPGLTTEITKDDIRNHALGFVVAGGVNTQVHVCFSRVNIAAQESECAGDVDELNAFYERGNLVTVSVESQVPVMVAGVLGSGFLTVRGESTVLINN